MEKNNKIFVAGDKSIVGAALIKYFKLNGFSNILSETICGLDLMDPHSVYSFFKKEKNSDTFQRNTAFIDFRTNRSNPSLYLSIYWHILYHCVNLCSFN